VNIRVSVAPMILTAYAIRSPLGSEESCVGLPRSVLGEAARILSMVIDMAGRSLEHPVSGKNGWKTAKWRRNEVGMGCRKGPLVGVR
jgi:hypothetical protein